ncbi:fungal pheromone precursor [Wolfiporia cocos MD-104 SS10]|uniref:Fungal pheromone n=1 Tax=Wolfiporia cocos (strain MD-104) TaxID=742152 RepID=A0A2H3JL46_WOLCO|nr:fungal pheromone precursor [Wolfiporia cocos MD-104 SS10]
MDAFFTISAPVPTEEIEDPQVPSNYDTTNGRAWSNCTIA